MPGHHATRALLTPNVRAISSIIGLAMTSPLPIRNIASDSAITGSLRRFGPSGSDVANAAASVDAGAVEVGALTLPV
jgi:hypothetical protein